MTTWGTHPETLRGVRIVDLTRLLPGPFATLLLADLGADVIKIEDPQGGDYARWYAPQLGRGETAMGALFAAVNRGKRSLSLNLKHDEGKAVLRRLVASADVVIESFRPGVMARLGVGPDALTELRPGLVYCAISGYGQTGPYRDRAGHDLDYLALSGALEQTGARGGPSHPPGFQLADLAGGGLYAAFAILAALFHRQRTGQGACLDISMTDGALSLMAPLLARVAAGDAVPGRGMDFLTGGLPCYRVYETRDGRQVALAALEPKFWMAFCKAVGHMEWSGSGHVPGSPIEPALEALFRTRDRDDWVDFLAPHDVCCEPVRSAAEVLDSELMRAREVFFTLGVPGTPASVQTATPATPPTGRLALRPPPHLGQHDADVLAELGYARAEIDALRAAGAIRS